MIILTIYNVVDVQPADSETKFCLREIIRDGNCKDHGPFKRDCHDEFFQTVGSWTMAKNCECKQLQENKRSCQCCINCDHEAKLLSAALHLRQINDTHDRCSK